MDFQEWNGFRGGNWTENIDVRDFINKNYTPYTGDGSFLSGPTERTRRALGELERLKKLEQERGGVLSVDTTTVSSLCNYQPGYLTNEDLIVGLQTDEPLKRGVNPFGGIRMARSACEAYGYKLSDKIEEYFQYRTTHNDGVFRIYTDEMKAARHCACSPAFPTHTGADGSSVTTVGWRSTASTCSLPKRRRTRPVSAWTI